MDVSQLRELVEEILPESEEERGNVPIYAANIPEPKLASPILRALGEAHPLPQLPHVKRIRKTQAPQNGVPRMSIVLCPAAEVTSIPGSETVLFPEAVAAVMQKYGLTHFLAEVPRRPARTLEESKEDCEVWPVTFHPNREGAGPVKQELTDEDLRSMWRFSQEALKQAQKAAACGQPPNGCVIVDPATGHIIASGFDHTGRHSPAHRPSSRGPQQMLPESSSSDIADSSSDAFERLESSRSAGSGSRENSGVVEPSKVQKKEAPLQDWHPLKHAAIVAIDAAAEADHRQFPDFGRFGDAANGSSSSNDASTDRSLALLLPPNGSHTANASAGKCLSIESSEEDETCPKRSEEKRRKLGLQRGEIDGGVFAVKPYLCTGFDTYLVREPCTMCAMALVHSRVRRVIFIVANARTGALGGHHNMQSKKSLNHHYSVFRLNIAAKEISGLIERC